MKYDIMQAVIEYTKRHFQAKRRHKPVTWLAAVVVFATTYALILPAVTLEGTACCGTEEHRHSIEAGCYEKRLVCCLAETESHTHTAECYTQERILTCGLDEQDGHTHTDECMESERILVCGDTDPEHEHMDVCYQDIQTYICGQEESAAHFHDDSCYEIVETLNCDLPEEAHTHSKECYEEIFTCGKTEHTHGLACYSDQTADLETAAQWEETLGGVRLTADWAEDVLAIARSQVGYTESERNYIVVEGDAGNEIKKGYSRYGAWYGDSYGDWCAMFVSFCLNYARIPRETVPYAAECPGWICELKLVSLYTDAADYIPDTGDIIFFDRDADGLADHVGLVEAVNENGGSIMTIEGDAPDCVRRLSYDSYDSRILGYGMLPENPEHEAETKVPEHEAETEGPEHEAETEGPENDTGTEVPGEASVRASRAKGAVNNGSVALDDDGNGTEKNLKDYIKKVTVQKKVDGQWEDLGENGEVSVNDSLNFKIAYTIPMGTLGDSTTIAYTLPQEIRLKNGTSGNVVDVAGGRVGTYTIDEGGKVTITFDESFAKSNARQEISGALSFEVNVSEIATGDDGRVTLPFTDDLEITIHATDKKIEDKSSLKVEKKQVSVNADTGEIRYQIKVSSTAGTNGDVIFNDTISDLAEITSSIVTVKDKNGNPVTGLTVSGSQITGTLSRMTAGDEYVIEYTAKLKTPVFDGVRIVDNKVEVDSTRSDGAKLHDDAAVTTEIRHTLLEKKITNNPWDTGTPTDVIQWTITVNPEGLDIGGWTLSDTLNGQPLPDSVMIKDSKGNVVADTKLPYTFPPDSKDTYTIEYTTSKDYGVGQWQPVNIAELKKNEETVTKRAEGPGEGEYKPAKKESVNIVENDGGKTATETWKVTICADKGVIPADWYFEDNLYTTKQWFTKEQLEYIRTALQNALDTAGLSGITYDFYAYPFENGDNAGQETELKDVRDGVRYKKFKVVFHQTLEKGQAFTFEVRSTANVEDVTGRHTFTNWAGVNGTGGTADLKYTPGSPTIRKVDQNGGNAAESQHQFEQLTDGTLKWEIQVTMPESYTGEELVIRDILPDDVTLTYLELRFAGVTGVIDVTDKQSYEVTLKDQTKCTGTVKIDGRTISVTVPKELAQDSTLKTIHLVVHAKISEDFDWKNNDENPDWQGYYVKSFNNIAELYEKDKKLGEASQKQIINQEASKAVRVLSKGTGPRQKDEQGNEIYGAYEDNNIPYYITVNPKGEDLVKNSATLTLKDVMIFDWGSASANLVPGSLHIYLLNEDGEYKLDGNGNKLELSAADYPYTYEQDSVTVNNEEKAQHTLIITLPDETALRVEYVYHISGETGVSASVSNTVTLEGTGSSDTTSQNSVQIVIQDSKATAYLDGISLIKMDKDNAALLLPGAKFDLYRWDSTANNYIHATDEDGKEVTLTTGYGGLASITGLRYNTAYKLVETQAPEGYYKNNEPYYFYLPGSDINNYPECKPTDFAGIQLTGGSVIYFPDEKETTGIRVEKYWLDEEGNTRENPSVSSVSFELYQTASTVPPGHEPEPEPETEGYVVFTGRANNGIFYGNNDGKIGFGSYPIGSVVTFQVQAHDNQGYSNPTLKVNDALVERTKIGEHLFAFNFNITVNDKLTTVPLVEEPQWVFSAGITQSSVQEPATPTPEPDPTPAEKGTLYGTYVITAANDWSAAVENLPRRGTDEDGNTVYYTYYVKEVGGEKYKVQYSDNNSGGILTGTITITNTEPDAPHYELPETGGVGRTPFITGGLALMAGCLLYGYVLRRKQERGIE